MLCRAVRACAEARRRAVPNDRGHHPDRPHSRDPLGLSTSMYPQLRDLQTTAEGEGDEGEGEGEGGATGDG